MQPVVFPRSAKMDRLRRDLICPELAVRAHLQLKLSQYLTCTAPSLTDSLGRKIVSPQDLPDILGLERRLFHMPGGVFLEVFTIFVNILVRCGSDWFARWSRLVHGEPILYETGCHLNVLKEARRFLAYPSHQYEVIPQQGGVRENSIGEHETRSNRSA